MKSSLHRYVAVFTTVFWLWALASCARAPIPTSDTPTPTRTPVPSSTSTVAPTFAPTASLSVTAGPTATSRPTRAAVLPAWLRTPIAYRRNARAILIEADKRTTGNLHSDAHVPLFRLYADGLVVAAGRPASLSTGLDAVVLTGYLQEAEIQDLLAFITESGFFKLDPLYQPRLSIPEPASAWITVYLDEAKTVRVVAPDSPAVPQAFRDAFDEILESVPAGATAFVPTEGHLLAIAAGPASSIADKNVIVEWPAGSGVSLADATDGTMVAGSSYARLVPVVAEAGPSTLYREGDRAYRVRLRPALPRASFLTDWLRAILEAPREFNGRTFDIVGYFRGANLLKEAPGSPPVTRSDWVIADDSGAMYVTGARPGLDVHSREDIWEIVRLRATVVYVRLGTSYLEARQVRVLSGGQGTRVSPAEASPAATRLQPGGTPTPVSLAP